MAPRGNENSRAQNYEEKSARLQAREDVKVDNTKTPDALHGRFGEIEKIMPHLQSKAEQLLSQPDLNQRHQFYKYCRRAVALTRGEKEFSEI